MSETLYNAVQMQIEKTQSDIYTALPAKVISFNGHTVQCQILINKVLADGTEAPYPPLVDVPAIFPHAGGYCVTVPIKAGDEGLVIFSSRCFDGWFSTGEQSKPLDNRLHDLSDGFFIVGANSVPKKIPDFYHEGASMQTDDGTTYIRLTKGTIYIQGDIVHKGNTDHAGDTTHAGNTQQQGNFSQTGNSTSSGTVTASEVQTSGGVVLGSHVHGGVKAGGDDTGAPK